MTKYLIAAAAGAALVIFAMNWVTKLEAAPSHTMVVAQSRSITHGGMVDRSRKGDRLDFARRQPAEGCRPGAMLRSVHSQSLLSATKSGLLEPKPWLN